MQCPSTLKQSSKLMIFPRMPRWKVTHKETLGPISGLTRAAVTIRGQYFPPGRVPGPGDCKVFLFIEGPTEKSVKRGKAELKRKLEEIMNQALSLPGGAQQRRYQLQLSTEHKPIGMISCQSIDDDDDDDGDVERGAILQFEGMYVL